MLFRVVAALIMALQEAVLPAAIKTYTTKTGRAVTATIDKTMYLPPARAEAGE